MAPEQNMFITCGGDKILRKWDIETHEMLDCSKPFDFEIRACDWSKDGILVVGDYKGYLYKIYILYIV